MPQNFTAAEVARFHSPYTEEDKRAQQQMLRSLAVQAQDAVTLGDVARVRKRVLHFRASLGPDDDTYDLFVDRHIDELGLNLLTYCNQRLDGRPEYAEQFIQALLT